MHEELVKISLLLIFIFFLGYQGCNWSRGCFNHASSFTSGWSQEGGGGGKKICNPKYF